ncbi:hypothetical protein QTG68_003991 [Vibrio vulnificus]|nr:hypothetical protein [Vibrio vulnificus]
MLVVEKSTDESASDDDDLDLLFTQARDHVVETRRGSVSGLQRKFKIGYDRAALIMEQLEACGVVSHTSHNGLRAVLIAPKEAE